MPSTHTSTRPYRITFDASAAIAADLEGSSYRGHGSTVTAATERAARTLANRKLAAWYDPRLPIEARPTATISLAGTPIMVAR